MITLFPSTSYRRLDPTNIGEERLLKLGAGEYSGMIFRNIVATKENPLVIEGPDEGVATFTSAHSYTVKVFNCQNIVFRGLTNSDGKKSIDFQIHLEFELFSSHLTVENVEFSLLDFRVATISAKTNPPANDSALEFYMDYPYRLEGVRYPESHHHHPIYRSNGDIYIKDCLFWKPKAPRTVSGKTGQTQTIEEGSCSKEQLYFGSTKEPSHESGEVVVENCMFVNSGLEAIQIAHANNCIIRNNTIINSGIDYTEGHVQQNAVQIGESKAGVFEKNIVVGAGQFNMYLQTGNLKIKDNVLVDPEESSIFIGRHKKYEEIRQNILNSTDPSEAHYQDLLKMVNRFGTGSIEIDGLHVYGVDTSTYPVIKCADLEVDILSKNVHTDSDQNRYFEYTNRNFSGRPETSVEASKPSIHPKPSITHESVRDEYWSNLGYGYNASKQGGGDCDCPNDDEDYVEVTIKVRKSQLKSIIDYLK